MLRAEPWKVNQNKSGIQLEQIEETFLRERESKEINIVKGTRFCFWRKNVNSIWIYWLKVTRKKSYSIIMQLFDLVTNIRLLLFNMEIKFSLTPP